jgi:DNA-binding MltR family transcriptional regulator
MKNYKTKRLIRNFVKSINSNIKVTFNRKGIVASDIIKRKIYLDIRECLTNDYQELQNHLNYRYNFKREVGLLPFILLHEIGHIQTSHKLENLKTELAYYSYNVRRLQESEMRVKSINKAYSRLKIEQLANDWAFEFAKSYHKQVIELKSNLEKLGF